MLELLQGVQEAGLDVVRFREILPLLTTAPG